MPDPSFADRVTAHGLCFPEDELPALEAFVANLEEAALFIRAVTRGYDEEPSNIFTLPAPKP